MTSLTAIILTDTERATIAASLRNDATDLRRYADDTDPSDADQYELAPYYARAALNMALAEKFAPSTPAQ
jgi:hypothetical protein